MRIVIDMQGAQTESRYRGIGRYTLSFAKAIARNCDDHEIILALNGLFPETIEEIRDHFRGIVPQENILVWNSLGPVMEMVEENTIRREQAELIWAFFIASLQPDVVHLSSLFEGYVDNAVTGRSRFNGDSAPLVSITGYDLIPLLNPEQYLSPNPRYQQHYLRKVSALESADVVLGISQSSTDEARQLLSESRAYFISMGGAIEPTFQPLAIAPATRECLYQKIGITRQFVLYAGGADERKNLPMLIRAYAGLPAQVKSGHQLVFAGKMPAATVGDLRQAAQAAGLATHELLFTDYVTDEDLLQLYNLCNVFVFPSWHEGFGLPALEAMSCGAPVIGANTASLPEVIGWDEALFDPHSVADITAKLEQTLSDETFREQLVQRGVQHSKFFCWNKTAKIAIAAWEKVNKKQGRVKSSPNYEELIDRLGRLASSCSDDHLRAQASALAENETQICKLLRPQALSDELSWRVEGPFDSSYSLALVNREIARALDRAGHKVALHSTEGPGDFTPDGVFLEKNPDLAFMHNRAKTLTQDKASVTSRFIYPPRVDDMSCQVNLLHAYGWEESAFPCGWTRSFNESLDGMTVMSEHVKKVMIDAGVTVPIEVCGLGIDHWDRIVEDDQYSVSGKEFRFLHVSSCFPRKGAEIMLRAYGNAFRKADDVTLIIKTMANPHNEIHRWLAEAQQGDAGYPDVLVIEDDLSDEQLKALYSQCHALVAPSYAEGFGLPMAEAILAGLAVITTGWSGQTDFCTKETAWLIDYSFEYAETHFELFNSVWAKPCEIHLEQLMHEVYAAPPETLKKKILSGQKLLRENFLWDQTAKRMVSSARRWVSDINTEGIKIGVLSTWNAKCGIATYSEHLVGAIKSDDCVVIAPTNQETVTEDSDYVVRAWEVSKESSKLDSVFNVLTKKKCNLVFIQFNYGFYNHSELSDLVAKCKHSGLHVVLTLHSTVDPSVPEHNRPNFCLEYLTDALKRCDRILVHSVSDLNRLKSLGLVNNVTLLPHGVVITKINTMSASTAELPLVASYGFCLPNKGLPELVEAVRILKDSNKPVRLKLVNAEYPVQRSANLMRELEDLGDSLGVSDLVSTEHRFLSDNDARSLLSNADVIIFPYQSSGESSSAAARFGFSCEKPVLVTPLEIFSDLKGAVYVSKGTDPNSIADAINSTLANLKGGTDIAVKIQQNADLWREQHDYKEIGYRLSGMFNALINSRSLYGRHFFADDI
ncbi:glycosyltransferase [Arenicellales bacterium IMCC58067]